MPSLDPNGFWECNANYVVKELADEGSECDCFKLHVPFPGLHMKETIQIIKAMTPIVVQPDILIDDKLNDVPETVEMQVRYAFSMGATHITVHASGGERMLTRAVQAAAVASRYSSKKTIVAVLVPTGMTDEEVLYSFGCPRNEAMRKFAKIALESGISDIVSGVPDIASVREVTGDKKIKIWAVGIRPDWYKGNGNHISVGTPKQAALAKADIVITGSPLLFKPSAKVMSKGNYYRDRVALMRSEMRF
jgi:orotidine-5'-phosphate decarboxylase